MKLFPHFPSDLANFINIAAIKAVIEEAEKLTSAQLEFAEHRIIMGSERKTMFMSLEWKTVFILSYNFISILMHWLYVLLIISANCILWECPMQ